MYKAYQKEETGRVIWTKGEVSSLLSGVCELLLLHYCLSFGLNALFLTILIVKEERRMVVRWFYFFTSCPNAIAKGTHRQDT